MDEHDKQVCDMVDSWPKWMKGDYSDLPGLATDNDQKLSGDSARTQVLAESRD